MESAGVTSASIGLRLAPATPKSGVYVRLAITTFAAEGEGVEPSRPCGRTV